MTKSKRILALVMAFIMMMGFCTSAFARVSDPNLYKTDPEHHLNSINKITLTAEEGASQILDIADDWLKETNLVVDYDLKVITRLATLHLEFTSIDKAFYYLYNVVKAVKDGDSTCLGNCCVNTSGTITNIAGTIIKILDLGDLEDLNIDALTNQNDYGAAQRRNWPVDAKYNSTNDIQVIANLAQFLSDNRGIVSKVVNGTISFGILDSTIKGINDTVKKVLTNMVGFLQDTLYTALWDSSAESAPEGFSYDTYVQKLVDWALIDGTGEAADNGGKSVLGANFTAFLPAIKNYEGAASVSSQSVYELVNNALQALLSGTVSDLLENLLISALKIDTSINEGKGDPAALDEGDLSVNTIVDFVVNLFVRYGAPAITFTDDEKTYPVPKIEKLLSWLFDEGALYVFIDVEEGKIGLTDNFVGLLNQLIRAVPGLLGNLPGEKATERFSETPKFSDTVEDDSGTDLYWTNPIRGGREAYKTTETKTTDDGKTVETTVYYYTDENHNPTTEKVNTTDSTASDYVNPVLIDVEYVYSFNNVAAYILKVVLNSLIDGCYFPDWADTVSEVGAYAVASVAARFIPENNYFDRLDAYHYRTQLGQSYTPLGTGTVTELAYDETLTLDDGSTVTIPRAAADIGASIGAYFLNGVFDVTSGFRSQYNTNSFDTDTTFETFVFEFLTWGVRMYMPIFVGEFDPNDNKFESTGYYAGMTSRWQTTFNTAWSSFTSLITQYGGSSYDVSNIPASKMRSVLFDLLDGTLFALFPADILPDWLEDSGSPSEALIYYWLGDSLSNFDLQQLFSLFQSNSDGVLNNPLVTVLLRLIDRVLGTVFGGNAILPTAAESNNRCVFDTPTSLTTLDSLLANKNNLTTFISMLLYELNIYIEPLATTLFPLLSTVAIKNAKYQDYDGNWHDYIGTQEITADDLEEYANEYNIDQNSTLFTGDKLYSTADKAAEVATAIGLENYTASEHKTVDEDGAERYAVPFPESYDELKYAEKAKDAAAEYSGHSCSLETVRDGLKRNYYVYEKMDYKEATTTTHTSVTTDGFTTNTYSGFTRAGIIKGTDGSNRSGSKGEVKYEEGIYRAIYTEDYSSSASGIFLRLSNSVSDSSDYVEEFRKYAEETLPNAYGDWLMYFVRMQLFTQNLYDRNDDGSYSVANDTNPSTPSSPYPFTASSGYSTKDSYSGATNYNFADTANEQVVKYALEYASNSENDVVLDPFDAEDVVRLALNTIAFDVTKNSSGEYNSGAKYWTDLTDAEKSTITNTCNSLGLTFNYDGENTTITRKAFALFTNSMNGSSAFGNYCTYKTDSSSGAITAVDTTSSVPLTPYANKKTHSSEDTASNNEVEQQIWESYIDFAKEAKEYTEGLKKHYDDISWRAASLESYANANPTLNTLTWVLAYTKKAYYPAGEKNGANRTYGPNGLQLAYTAESFEEFQKCYDYAEQLKKYVQDGGLNSRQSIVTTAYRSLLDAYYKLKAIASMADWTQLENYITLAETYLNGPLGLDANGEARENGYTKETLENLQKAYTAAKDLFDNNKSSWDVSKQTDIDKEASDLWSVIKALVFKDGKTPGVLVNTENIDSYKDSDDTIGDGDSKTKLYDAIKDVQTTKTNTYSAETSQKGLIFGLAERIGLTKTVVDNALYVTGLTIDENNNVTNFEKSGLGYGTGSYYSVKQSGTEVARYYAVVIGDLNGDACIDGNDRAILDMYYNKKAFETDSEEDLYFKAAADVDHNGVIDANDIAKIKANYTKIDQVGTDAGTVDGTIIQNTSIKIVSNAS